MKAIYFILLFLTLIAGNVLAGDYSDFQGNTLRETSSGNLWDTKTGQNYYYIPQL